MKCALLRFLAAKEKPGRAAPLACNWLKSVGSPVIVALVRSRLFQTFPSEANGIVAFTNLVGFVGSMLNRGEGPKIALVRLQLEKSVPYRTAPVKSAPL